MRSEKEIYADIGEWMREQREGAGLSLEEAAKLAGWSLETLRAFEKGGPITVAELKRFALLFLVERDELIDTILLSHLKKTPGEQ